MAALTHLSSKRNLLTAGAGYESPLQVDDVELIHSFHHQVRGPEHLACVPPEDVLLGSRTDRGR